MKAKFINENYPPGAQYDKNAPRNEDSNQRIEVKIDEFGYIMIEYSHQIAEDDWEADDASFIDPLDMSMRLGLSFGLSLADIDDGSIEIDIKDIKQLNDNEWLFTTNYGDKKLSLGELEKLA
ncbi:MAG: hypothetical protein WC554_12195, partial [Clostridia bacterium]